MVRAVKALVLLGFSDTPAPQTFLMELINSAALPTSATVSKLMISPVPSRCIVIAAIENMQTLDHVSVQCYTPAAFAAEHTQL